MTTSDRKNERPRGDQSPVDEKLFKAYELYLTERTRLTSAKLDQSKAYDQAILVYAAGAIALSITFLDKIVKEPSARTWLYISWILFALAMLSTLYSLLAAQKAFEREISDLGDRYQRLIGLPKEDTASPPSPRTAWGVTLTWLTTFAKIFAPAINAFSTIVRWLNRLAGVFFFLGIVCFGWFANENWAHLRKEEPAVADTKKSDLPQRDRQFPSRTINPGTGAVPDRGELPPVKVPDNSTSSQSARGKK